MESRNPWGENWNVENYSSAEMDSLLAKVFSPKLEFMGFKPAGSRKWARERTNGSFEVVKLHCDRGFIFYASFGLSFSWIPHSVNQSLKWHRTAKSALLDLRFKKSPEPDWSISKQRKLANDRANQVSMELCEACEAWFLTMRTDDNVTRELERKRARPHFYGYVQDLTVWHFWTARKASWPGLDQQSRDQLKSYFGETDFQIVEGLLNKEAASSGAK